MFSGVLREHQAEQQKRHESIESLRKTILKTTAPQLSDVLCDSVNERISVLFLTQREIEFQAKTLAAASSKFAKNAQQWANLVDQFSDALKELGDVDSWTESVEKELAGLFEILGQINEAEKQES
eukprot:ANDGO_01707.mRNA.1 Biogenesis of lysosome-related organelles complex 1 subunit 1